MKMWKPDERVFKVKVEDINLIRYMNPSVNVSRLTRIHALIAAGDANKIISRAMAKAQDEAES